MDKTIVLGVSGGIAAYKSADLVSRFVKQGYRVNVVMTENATRFISPLTMETLSNNPVAVDTFAEKPVYEIEHISLAKKADAFVIAPATANIIAKLAHGIADDMLSTTLLATTAPVIIAPAMNENMWAHPATQHNVDLLTYRGVHFIGPAKGKLACGDYGYGRMVQPEEILDAVAALLDTKQDYSGKRLIVTAGPTQEEIDPVRYITNNSSGKMGYEIARAAAHRGAEVTLVHGPTNLDIPAGVKAVPVRTTQQMLAAVLDYFEDADMVIKAAAPADYRPKQVSERKIKKSDTNEYVLQLVPNPDILSTLAERRHRQVIVGFAAESHDLEKYALDKLKRKSMDMIVANDITRPGAGFGADTNRVTVYKKDGYKRDYPTEDKYTIANYVLDEALLFF